MFLVSSYWSGAVHFERGIVMTTSTIQPSISSVNALSLAAAVLLAVLAVSLPFLVGDRGAPEVSGVEMVGP